MDPRERAIRLLRHYIMTAFGAAGLQWDGDNNAEIADLVDYLIDAAKKAVLEDAKQRQEENDSGSYAEYKHRYGHGIGGTP